MVPLNEPKILLWVKSIPLSLKWANVKIFWGSSDAIEQSGQQLSEHLVVTGDGEDPL